MLQDNLMDTQKVKLSIRYNFNAAHSKYRGTGAGSDNKARMQDYRGKVFTVSIIARTFSTGVPACTLWQEQQMYPPSLPNVSRHIRVSAITSSTVPLGRIRWFSIPPWNMRSFPNALLESSVPYHKCLKTYIYKVKKCTK